MDSNEYNNDEQCYDYANLPTEIVLQIFCYLNYGDQEAVSMTCTRWFEASVEYFAKVKINFTKICLSDDSYPGEIFINTNRPYKNIDLIDVVLCQPDHVIKHLGNTITNISLVALDLTQKQFCLLLNNLECLSEINIENMSQLFMSGQFLDTSENREMITNSMANIKRLSLQNNAYLSDAILLRIIELIKNLKSLNLSGCHIACHNAIQKRFYPQHLADTPSESLLTLKYVLKVVTAHASSLTDLNLSDTLVDGVALSAIAEIKNLQLKKLTVRSCRQLNHHGFERFVEVQKCLTYLDLSSSDGINDACIEQLKHLMHLEVLHLAHCKKLTDNSSKVLSTFNKLRILDLSNCIGMSSNGVKDNLVKAKNPVLRELYLSSIDLYEDCLIQCAENLSNLRVLDVGYCCNGVTDKSLRAVIKNLVYLRSLNMQCCHLITDAGMTGCNLDKLTVKSNGSGEAQPQNMDMKKTFNSMKISLRSKAEQQIVDEMERAKQTVSLLNWELALDNNSEAEGISNLKGLESLNLSGCIKLTDITLKYGLKFHEMRKLSIANCPNISAVGIESLVSNCGSIEDLDLSFSRNLNQETVQSVQDKLKRLRVLRLKGCSLD